MMSDGTNDILWAVVRNVMTVPIAIGSVIPTQPPDIAYDQTNTSGVIVAQAFRQNESMLCQELVAHWLDETAFHSSPTLILRSEYFQRSKALGNELLIDQLLPLLGNHPYHAIIALGDLVEPLPFGEELAGDLDGQVKAWKDWASEQRSEGSNTEMVSEFDYHGVGGD